MNFYTTKGFFAFALTLLGASPAFTAPPVAPQVTVGAEIKQLHFDWSIVPRSNYYEFWFKANNGAPWVKFSELQPWQPHAVNNISAHLLDWDQARYQIKACNFSGCTPSPELAVHDRMFESIGYFKPSGSYRAARFGSSASISEDGQTIAAFAADEPVPGGHVSTLYIFAKVNGSWQQQKRIIPSTTVPDRHNVGEFFEGQNTVALSADGNRLVTSLLVCDAPGGTCDHMLSVWHRSGPTWTREYQVVGQSIYSYLDPVQINEAGDRILIGAGNELAIFERTAAGWTKHAPLPAVPANYLCDYTGLSGDGMTLAHACYVGTGVHLLIAKAPGWNITQDYALSWPLRHAFGGFAIDYAGATVALATNSETIEAPPPDARSQVQVLRLANGSLSTAIIRAEGWTPSYRNFIGGALALSRDGSLLAVGDSSDQGLGRGVLSPPLQAGDPAAVFQTGATSIYELRPAGPHLRRVIKPNDLVPRYRFNDQPLAFANNGKTLLIADSEDSSNATGINGDRDDTSFSSAGALWLY
ncbi:MAG TPA: hypothetical protein VK624_04550 [Steroidobacteraceae bacterium]|nr:hypothetical protein [Steroidobacteraceae bacterium]